MVPSSFLCDRCDFRGSNSFWGSFVYDLDGKLTDMSRAAGWCASCETTSAIEDLSGLDVSVTDNSTPGEGQSPDIEWLKDVVASEPARNSWFSGVFETKKAKARKERHRKRAIEEAREERERYWIMREVASRRDLQGKCLMCGSTAVTLFHDARTEGAPEAHWPYFIHPGCGGALYSKSSSLHVSVGLKRRHYTIDADFLYEERYDLSADLFKGTAFEK